MDFQFIGAGITPPEKTEICGKKFSRDGRYQDVTDPNDIAMLTRNPSFRTRPEKKARKKASK